MSFAFGMTCAVSSFSGTGIWTPIGPYGGSVTGLALSEVNPDTLLAVGRGGVFRSVNAGSSWSRVEVGLPSALEPVSVAASTTSSVMYIAERRRIYRSEDSGSVWLPTTSTGAVEEFVDFSLRRGTDNSVAVASHDAANVSTDGGTTWTAALSAGTNVDFSNIEYASDGVLYLSIAVSDPSAFAGAVVLKSVDAGASWSPTASQPAIGGIRHLVVSPVDPKTLFASGSGKVALSIDGGNAWTFVELPDASICNTNTMALASDPSVETALFVGCGYRGLFYSTDATVASPVWRSIGVMEGFTANGVFPAQASSIAIHPSYAATPTVWIGTPEGGLFKSVDDASHFIPINQGYESTNIRPIVSHPGDTGASATFLAGYGDALSTTTIPIFRSQDSGLSWVPSAQGISPSQIRGIAIDPTTVDTDPATAEDFIAYAVGYATGIPLPVDRNGGIYKSMDAGRNWVTIDSGLPLLGLAHRPFMGSVRTVVVDPRSCVTPPPSGPCPIGGGHLQTLYVAGAGVVNGTYTGTQTFVAGRIYKSTNAGASWLRSDNGLPEPEDLGPTGSDNFAYTFPLTALVIDPSDSQILYSGSVLTWFPEDFTAALPTIANGVFKSIDGGTNWTLASDGLPTVAGPKTSHWDVLALAINPFNSQILYAGITSIASSVSGAHVFKTTNGGDSWSEASVGLAGRDVRSLLIDVADASGNTLYAGTGGDSANPGGVFRSVDGGATWNSVTLNLPPTATPTLSIPNRGLTDPVRILVGTRAGIWDYTQVPDDDADGVPTSVENVIGDGNGDLIPDATQPDVASVQWFPGTSSADGSQPNPPPPVWVTMNIISTPGSCDRFNDATVRQASLYPPDPIGTANSLVPNGLVRFALPNCAAAKVRIKYNTVFDNNWRWRNYGPRIPGEDASFGWYSFTGARLIDAQTWELDIDATRQGNYRDDANNILFVGGPSLLHDFIFDHGFE